MKLETKRKIRRWVCRRLGLPETEMDAVTVPYPTYVYYNKPVTLCAQGAFQKSLKEAVELEDIMKKRLASVLAETMIEDGYCGVDVDDSKANPELRLMTVQVMVVPWEE